MWSYLYCFTSVKPYLDSDSDEVIQGQFPVPGVELGQHVLQQALVNNSAQCSVNCAQDHSSWQYTLAYWPHFNRGPGWRNRG